MRRGDHQQPKWIILVEQVASAAIEDGTEASWFVAALHVAWFYKPAGVEAWSRRRATA
jgi:hypothetical protein